MAVSALDYCIHEICQARYVAEMYHGTRPETPASCDLQISLESVRQDAVTQR